MKTLVTGAVIVLGLALSACAGTGGRNGFAKGMSSSMDDDIDYEKVIAVNEWATRRQATVVWLNYPKKPVRAKNDNG